MSQPTGGSLSIQSRVVLSQFSSWKVGGLADYYCAPASVGELQEALKWAARYGIPVSCLSGGTNVLISDDGVEGLVIHLRKLSAVEAGERDGRIHVTALAGASKSELLRIFLKYRLEAAIFLSGLPGDIGGGVVMNAGVGESASPREFVEITDWIEVLEREGASPAEPEFKLKKFKREELNWGYRHCDGWQPGVIVRVGLSWPNLPNLTVMERVRGANQARLKKQPLEWPSCGSVFINPPDQKSGQLIDACGLRGLRVGGAEVSEKHANFIINREHATARDIDSLIRRVQQVVLEQCDVHLQTEVVYMGRWSSG